MHADLVQSLQEGELQPLRDWLADQGVDTTVLSELPLWDSTRFPELLPASRRPADRTAHAEEEVLAQLPKVTAADGGVALLLLYVHLAVEAEWEISYHYRPLWDTLRGAHRCMSERWPMTEGADATLARAVLALMESLDAQISAENAMTTGQLAVHEAVLQTVVAAAREVEDLARSCIADFPDLSGYLVARAVEYEAYYTAVAAAVRGVGRFMQDGESLEPVIETLRVAEDGDEITDPIYLSELRADRFTLMALNRERHSPWMRIDRGKVVYVYPFALCGAPVETVMARVRGTAADWNLAGVQPVAAHDGLQLDDVWDGSGLLERHYSGAYVELPEVVISGADGRELGRAGVQIRFSDLGNHFVRFESDIEDATPDELYALMFRAAPEHGVARLVFADASGQEWPRMADLAVEFAEAVGGQLRLPHDPEQIEAVAHQGTFHVIVCIDAASTAPGPASDAPRREVFTPHELNAAVGAQVFTNPITYMVGTVAEWIRYSVDNELSSVFTGLTGEQTTRTSNTTAITAPGSARWTQETRCTVVEFAVSVDALFAGWSVDLAHFNQRLKDFKTRMDAAGSNPSAQTLGALSRALDAEKIHLNYFAVEVRRTLALIQSPSLLSSQAGADSLRMLLDRSSFHRRLAELNAGIEEVAHDKFGAIIAQLQERRHQEEERRLRGERGKLEVFLAVIAAAGLSGIVQVLQAGFFESITAAEWAGVAVAGIMALALALGLVFWRTAERDE